MLIRIQPVVSANLSILTSQKEAMAIVNTPKETVMNGRTPLTTSFTSTGEESGSNMLRMNFAASFTD